MMQQTLHKSEDLVSDNSFMKKLIDNPNFAYDLGQKLYETVKDTYDLNVVTKNRAELYKSLVK
jgi:hypothetical protein